MKKPEQARSSPLCITFEDLERCHYLLGPETWRSLVRQKIFISGGTGFVGKWLLATLLDANEVFNLKCSITVLSRNPDAFLNDWPAMAGRVDWIVGDVRDFPLGEAAFDTIIHAATDVVAGASPQSVFSTCVDGTNRMLELAHRSKASRFLLVSSGAIYGPLPHRMANVGETHLGGPDTLQPGSGYSEGKRVSEWLTAQAASDQLEVKIARVFALVGPHLPLDKQFAIGNFLSAAIMGDEIVITGDGKPLRSYLYAADMSAWLWSVLLKGVSGEAYNVGAEEAVSIATLANRVRQVLGSDSRINIKCQSQTGAGSSYVPDCRKAKSQLGLPEPLSLDEAIVRTANWYKSYLKMPL